MEPQTITEAKQTLKDNWIQGTTCPCCRQIVKLNKYKMSFGHAKVMIDMYKLHKQGKDWIHVNSEIKPQGRQFSEAKHWYLIEPMPNTDKTKRTSGYWRLTESGKRFVRGEIQVPHEIRVYNDKRYPAYETNPNTVTIRQALKGRFDYSELMEGFMPFTQQGSLL